MNYTIKCITALLIAGSLSGCMSSLYPNIYGNDQRAGGGVLRSENAGQTFVLSGTIDEERSLDHARILSLVMDPFDNRVLYAGTLGSGLYRTLNAGATWEQIAFEPRVLHDIAIDHHNTSTLYVTGVYEERGKIYKTTDSGASWQEIYFEPQPGVAITALALAPHDPQIIYAATGNGVVVRSNDGGNTWDNLRNVDARVRKIIFDAEDPATFYLLADDELMKTRDSGVSFVDVASLERDDEIGVYKGRVASVAVSPLAGGTVVVGTDDGVYRSSDYGQSWTEVNIIGSAKGIPIYALTLSEHDVNGITFAAAQAVYASTPEGSWAITDTTQRGTVSDIIYDPIDNNVIYIGLGDV